MELAATAMTCEYVTAMIRWKFDDGIMSAVDFDISVTRVESFKGDRAKVEMPGKRFACNCW